VLTVIYGLKQIAQDGMGRSPRSPSPPGWRSGLCSWPTSDGWWIHIGIGLFRIAAIQRRVGGRLPGLVVAVGYFLFVAQHLQLVVGLSPLRAVLGRSYGPCCRPSGSSSVTQCPNSCPAKW
jgi:MFS transporter, DHA2 family, multidrug resistance protein